MLRAAWVRWKPGYTTAKGRSVRSTSFAGYDRSLYLLLAPPPPPPAAPKVATRANVGTLPGTPVKLERTSIFKPSFETPRQKLLNDAFSSDGTAAKVLASAGSPLSWVPHALLAQVRQPFLLSQYYDPKYVFTVGRRT